ncbi:hypothetical protein RINTU1_23870 [Candidatus Regiella insecticola]|uniref:Uncharacterized protein n=1 Tax=Candidatus Regiella insecticola TaxID=138073 RepID=A0A6L2ZQK4_9ENTR|nr:hypothetical protein RINTU1_23870 [Candidatus Regiella insecticola]
MAVDSMRRSADSTNSTASDDNTYRAEPILSEAINELLNKPIAFSIVL